MDPKVKAFLENHRIGVLSVLTSNNLIHSATIHYAASFEPLEFIFLTDKNSKKVEPLATGAKVTASLVIGFSEEEWVTLQMHGTAHMPTKPTKISRAWEVYSVKFVGSEKYKTEKESTLIVFTPTWWRYTKLKPRPGEIISSEGN